MSAEKDTKKRGADTTDDAKEEKKAKKAKTDKSDKGEKKAKREKKTPDTYSMNVAKAVDKKHENKSFAEIVKLPPSALQGLADNADAVFAEYKMNTIADMGNWKYYKLACAIVELSKIEVKAGRGKDSKCNINGALSKKYEKHSLKDICKLKLSAFEGISEDADTHFDKIKNTGVLESIQDLAKSKYFKWAEALNTFAAYERADFSS